MLNEIKNISATQKAYGYCLSLQVMSDSFATPWTIAHQTPPSMGFPRQEYWSGLPFPSPGALSNRGIDPASPALAGGFLTGEPPGKLKHAVGTWEMLQGVKTVQWEKALPDDPYLFVGILLLAGTSSSRKAPCKAMCLVSQQGSTE